MMLYKCTVDYRTRQLFLLELQSDGSYVIKLKNTPSLVLTANGTVGSTTGTVTMSERTDALTNQTWNLTEYEAYLPKSAGDTEYPKVSYAKLEQYYNSLGFGSPFGTSTDPITVTSDFGKRNTSVHRGLDLRAAIGTQLFAPYAGTVVQTYDESTTTKGGYYVKVDTGISAYKDSEYTSEYTIHIVYMHMSSIAVSEGDEVKTSTLLGLSGNTGNVEAHLHYGVFLRKSGQSKSANTNPINPLLFVEPYNYNNGESVEQLQV